MPTPAEQLCNLLNYVVEQSKEIDPHGYKLTGHKGFLRQKAGLAGLPGVHFNREVEGDHVWLQVERLEAQHPPAVHPDGVRGLLTVSEDPGGKPPSINEPAVAHRLSASAAGKPPEQLQQEASDMRSSVEKALAQYSPLWNAWAAGEKPRRTTIDLYGDLFSLAHQLESEETAKPQELVWGLGVTAWKVSAAEGVGIVDFQYPLITQAIEISVEEDLSIVLRPRGVEPRLEFDALSA
ncbi:MAG TPA: very short patch repair endonuclease, partial [Ramlibacter sp.]|nr:very short patch repair endonuclease [Ramlibacter sp.]